MYGARKMTWGAAFVALGILVPMLFHSVGLGPVFLPMHIPVLLCGLFCGTSVGMLVGAFTPLVSAALTGMPPFLPPTAQLMAFELGTYGLLTGYLYTNVGLGVYPTLVTAMVSGRIIYGLTGYFLIPLFGLNQIPLWYPITYGLIKGIPGIIIQLLLVPGIVYLVERNGKALFSGKKKISTVG
jgi:hypothetical protein